MSFQDIEAGRIHPVRTLSSQSKELSAFESLQHSLSIQMFKMNANAQGITKLVEQLGTARDSVSLRKALQDLTETTRAMAKRGSEDLKRLSSLQSRLPHKRTALQKTSQDFKLSLVAFQQAQKASAERQRLFVRGFKLVVDVESDAHNTQVATPQEQRQAQILQGQLSPYEISYQEPVIHEREAEIREIETGIQELSEIFRDLGKLVNDQEEMVDHVGSNIFSVATDTGAATEELHAAMEYQRKAGKRAACLMIVLAVVVGVVLLAVLC